MHDPAREATMTMSSSKARETVLGFLQAIYARDVAKALAVLDDDFDFVCHVPVQIFPHLGARHGKTEIAATLGAVQHRYNAMRHEVVFIAAEGDRVAAIVRVHLQKRASDRVMSFLVADFFTLRNGLIVEQRQFMDSFDLVQQVLEREVVDDIARLVRARTLVAAE